MVEAEISITVVEDVYTSLGGDIGPGWIVLRDAEWKFA